MVRICALPEAILKHKARTHPQTSFGSAFPPKKTGGNIHPIKWLCLAKSVSHDLHDFSHCSIHVFPQNTVSRWCLSKVTLDQDF